MTDDYIRRKAVIEDVESWLNMDRYFCPNSEHDSIPITELYALLKRIPAADVAEAKRAHLVIPNPYGKCSACGMLIDIRDRFNYCPNCGAKMDGGANDAVD